MSTQQQVDGEERRFTRDELNRMVPDCYRLVRLFGEEEEIEVPGAPARVRVGDLLA
jgi:hypothetical protein